MGKLLKNILNLEMNPSNSCIIALKRFSDVVNLGFVLKFVEIIQKQFFVSRKFIN